MKCPDCDFEVDSLTRKGVCNQCSIRINQLNYLNRKNGENKPYIPLKELKKLDPKNYNRIMGRRNINSNNKKAEQKAKVIEHKVKPNKIPDLNTQDKVVMQDILDTFKENEAEWPKDTATILPVFQQLEILLNNYIGIYLTAEDILNKMELDYKHAKEFYNRKFKDLYIINPNGDECLLAKEKKDLWEERHSTLLEKRRGIKNVIAEYKVAGVLFTELSSNREFMKKFNKYFEDLQKVNSIVSQGNYRAEVSKLVSEEDFCYGFKANTTADGLRKFQVVVKTRYRNNISNFTRQVWAKNEEDAKQQVIDFIESDRDKFRFNFKSNEIMVTEINNSKEGL